MDFRRLTEYELKNLEALAQRLRRFLDGRDTG